MITSDTAWKKLVIRDGPLEIKYNWRGEGIFGAWIFLKVPFVCRNFFARTYDYCFWVSLLAGCFKDKFSLQEVFWELSPHLRLFSMVRPNINIPCGFALIKWILAIYYVKLMLWALRLSLYYLPYPWIISMENLLWESPDKHNFPWQKGHSPWLKCPV